MLASADLDQKPAHPPTFRPDEASSWRRTRQYAVPRWMIEQATALRLARNWQGALAAANIDLTQDLAGIAKRYGSAVVVAVATDLTNLAPDLLRWHLPRYLRGRTTIRPNQRVILAGYGDRPADGPYLYVTTQHGMVDGPQRLSLRFGSIERDQGAGREQNWTAARHLWDARCAGELRERSGGGRRAPFHDTDGTLLGRGELPVAEPGVDDPAGHTEWVTMLHDRGDVREAFDAAGIALDDARPQGGYFEASGFLTLLGHLPLALTRWEPEIRLLAAAGFGGRFRIPLTRSTALLLELDVDGYGLRASHAVAGQVKDVSTLPEAAWRRLPDLDLLRCGDIVPERLHPLVSAALFPEHGAADGPADRPLPAPVLVRCRGEWHEAGFRDGRLQVPHSDEEQRRERALQAFGGPVAGCFAVQQAWTSGVGRLPKGLRDQRQELFSLVQHGDTAGVHRLLDAGLDPRARDGRRRTLLHVLYQLDHEMLLPRLLAAGLDIEARDQHECTPLHMAVGNGSTALVWALLGAGARTDVVDRWGRTLPGLIVAFNRKELRFLKESVETEHPDLVRKYPTRGEWDE